MVACASAAALSATCLSSAAFCPAAFLSATTLSAAAFSANALSAAAFSAAIFLVTSSFSACVKSIDTTSPVLGTKRPVSVETKLKPDGGPVTGVPAGDRPPPLIILKSLNPGTVKLTRSKGLCPSPAALDPPAGALDAPIKAAESLEAGGVPAPIKVESAPLGPWSIPDTGAPPIFDTVTADCGVVS